MNAAAPKASYATQALASGQADTVLTARGLARRFGGLVAVAEIDLHIPEATVVGIIGPNGAGKTTLLNVLSGALTPHQGSIHLDGADITRANAAQRAERGLRRTFQNIRIFPSMSVLENVLTGMHVQTRGWVLGGILRWPAVRSAEVAAAERSYDVLEALDLHRRCHDPAGSLSYGEQRRLEIARALAASPRVLLLDEPAAGLNSAEKQAASELISSLPSRFGTAVVLVEHDMRLVSETCAQITVLEYGRLLCSGDPDTVLSDHRVIDAYLGAEEEHDVAGS